MTRQTRVFLAGAFTLVLSGVTWAQQQPNPAAPPDSPKPKQDQSDQNESKNPFSAPIGLIARRSYVYPEIATTPGPLTPKEKFELFLSKSSSPPQILSSMVSSGISQARNTLPGYGQGWEGYGNRFGSSLASGASSHFFGTFLLPSVLHEDPRYFVKMRGRWYSRGAYAVSRVFVVRTDTGNQKFNIPATLGPLLAEGLANVYLPQSERTSSKTFQRFGIRIGFGAANNFVKEYWPTIFKSLRIGKVAPDLKPNPTPGFASDESASIL